MPVGHVKNAPSITLHTGQGERKGQSARQTVRDGDRDKTTEISLLIEAGNQKSGNAYDFWNV